MLDIPPSRGKYTRRRRNQNKTLYKCPECPKTYVRKRCLQPHIMSHFNQKRPETYECYLCRHQFSSWRECSLHMRQTHCFDTNSRYKCLRCDFDTRYRSRLVKHAIICAGAEVVCITCGQMFVDVQTRCMHQETCGGRFQCEVCGAQLTTRFFFARHMERHSDKHKYECNICQRTFRLYFTYRDHIASHRRSMECYMCSKQLSTINSLREHFRIKHSMGTEDSVCLLKRTCSICDKVFSSKTYLSTHMRFHGTHRKMQCSMCDFSTVQRRTLINHEKTHRLERDFKCDVCKKDFKTLSNMNKHKSNVHTKKECEVCGHEVAVSRLDGHMRKHTGEGLFECTQCDKKFDIERDLIRHMLVHSDQRNFSCDLCSKKFKAKHTLVAHRRIHLGDFMYTCQWCGKGFHDIRSYKKHTLAKHGREWNDQAGVGKCDALKIN